MITTIQVHGTTLRVLKKYREQMNARSYDEVIQKLAVKKPRESFWGAGGKLSMKEILEGLRDEKNRL